MDKKYAPLKKYIDYRLAHESIKDLEQLPKIGDLHECMDLLESLFNKYYALHTAGSYPSLLPTIQVPWRQIFKIPWSPPPQKTAKKSKKRLSKFLHIVQIKLGLKKVGPAKNGS